MGLRTALDGLPNLPFNRVGLLDVSSGTQNAVAGSPERPGVKYPLGVSQHPPPEDGMSGKEEEAQQQQHAGAQDE